VSDDDPQLERTDHDDEARQPDAPQEELNRESRATGGDAPAAGSIEEREAVAADEDHLFDGDGDDDGGDDGDP
jgi:primase-polymerase (primpol)-like protein